MGVDIHGWVEIREVNSGAKPPYDVQWHGVVKIYPLMIRNYDMFSCLFGVSAYAQFLPIAPNRGLPLDISDEATADYLEWDAVCGESWVGWTEIATIDWSEDALDTRPHRYERNALGELVFVTAAAPLATDVIEEGRSWQVGATIYKVERITGQQARSHDWELLFRLMQELVHNYGEDGVRLVVWFDH